ncbi:pseudouridine-5'-phosphatase-like [Drosophila bipectinata]|uniref:pseudouridine-5'-phosphatase-like n=1 Tax=Drosophila bipectinata TaxID=42026 RepID=UPI0007E5C14C|nr:pseudouridine-5'-phosphatase-like [Drosophila bipectinata]
MCSPSCKSCKAPPQCSRCPPMCCSPGISYCIFDLETAVFDTRHVYQKALIDLATSYNRVIPELLMIQIGPMETAEMAELICRKLDMPVSWETFRYQLNERTSELIANPPLMPGVERLVRHLCKCCMGLGLVTSCSESRYCSKIKDREEFFEHFSTIIFGDDAEVRAVKPQPDVYLIAMSRLGDAGPDCTLVFEGTPQGVQAAIDARLPVVMLAESTLPCCWSELATLRLETLEEFDPEEFNMPPYSCTEPPPRKVKRKSRRSSQISTGSRSSAAIRAAAEAAAAAAAEEGGEEEQEEAE